MDLNWDLTPKLNRSAGGKWYRNITIPGHPLADSHNRVLIHRAVLYNKIGPGLHPCHWCGCLLEWSTGSRKQEGRINADHLDGVRTNNDPSNLVPSCHGCNALRERGWRIRDGELFLLDSRGDRVRAEKIICRQCGVGFIGQVSRKKLYCSKPCQSAAQSRSDETHCIHGHEFTPENTKYEKNGARKCRECHRAASLRYVKSMASKQPTPPSPVN